MPHPDALSPIDLRHVFAAALELDSGPRWPTKAVHAAFFVDRAVRHALPKVLRDGRYTAFAERVEQLAAIADTDSAKAASHLVSDITEQVDHWTGVVCGRVLWCASRFARSDSFLELRDAIKGAASVFAAAKLQGDAVAYLQESRWLLFEGTVESLERAGFSRMEAEDILVTQEETGGALWELLDARAEL